MDLAGLGQIALGVLRQFNDVPLPSLSGAVSRGYDTLFQTH
jgi:hypothetical protein